MATQHLNIELLKNVLSNEILQQMLKLQSEANQYEKVKERNRNNVRKHYAKQRAQNADEYKANYTIKNMENYRKHKDTILLKQKERYRLKKEAQNSESSTDSDN
jgi:hypothetical protein